MPNLTTLTLSSGNITSSGTISTIDNCFGTAGTSNANVQTIQGISGMTGVITKLQDGSGNNLTSTSSALDINVKSGGNSNGLAIAGNSAPVIPATTTVAVPVAPGVTTSAYVSGNVIGGIITFTSILDSVRFAGILESITVKFKGSTVTGNIAINIFKASPSNGTYTDHSAPTWNAADMTNMLGTYTLSTPVSNLGTMTVYNLDGIGKAIQGTTQSLFVVATVGGTPTLASTSDMTIELGMLPG